MWKSPGLRKVDGHQTLFGSPQRKAGFLHAMPASNLRLVGEAALLLILLVLLAAWSGSRSAGSLLPLTTLRPYSRQLRDTGIVQDPHVPFKPGTMLLLDSGPTQLVVPANPRIYLAPLPAKYLSDAWRQYVGVEQAAYDFAAPLGNVVEGDLHLRMTNQFANDLWWYHQLSTSPLRVHRYEDADLVFVPGIFARGDPYTEQAQHQIFMDFFEEYPAFLPNVSDKPHVIGYPRDAWDNLATLKDNPKSAPFLFTAIESFTSRDSGFSDNLVVIPYQGHLHHSRGWRPPLLRAEELAQEKSLLVSESFSTRLEFRAKLAAQCAERPGQCAHHEFQDHNATNFLASWRLTQRSWYCFQPPGDSPTRRSFFDCLLAGTIPVVFDYKMLTALPFIDVLDWYSLVVVMNPKDVQADSANAIDLLAARHSPEAAAATLAAIHEAAGVLQYSLNPQHELIRYDRMHRLDAGDDAFTASWKAILRKLCAAGRLPAAKCRMDSDFRAADAATA